MGHGKRAVRVCSLLVVVNVAVGGLKLSKGMRIVALTPLWSRNAWVRVSASCIWVVMLWVSCIRKWSMHVAFLGWCVGV